jgi:hypothetical protein
VPDGRHPSILVAVKAVALAFAIALVCAASAAADEDPPPSPLPARIVTLYGDSIATGHGMTVLSDDDPSFLQRIDLIADSLITANDAGGRLYVRRANTQDFYTICYDVLSDAIRTQDDVVFENAGPHFNNGAAYQKWIELVVFCSDHGAIGAQRRSPARLILTTMFDYNPAPSEGPAEYDKKVPGDGRTINQIISQVAVAQKTSLLDWNRQMDAAHTALEPLGVHVVHPDGIHPTVFGNILLAASLLIREGIPVLNAGPLIDELMAQEPRIVAGGMAPAYTRDQATQWVASLVHFAALRGKGR